MNQEPLSLLLDDRLSESDARRLFDRMRDDVELADDWARYQWAHSIRQGAQPIKVGRDFTAALNQRLDQETPLSRAPARLPTRRRVWLQPALGLALAASLSAIAVMAVREFDQGRGVINAPLASLPVQPAGQGVLTPAQLETYLRMHTESVSYLAGNGDLLLQARVGERIGR